MGDMIDRAPLYLALSCWYIHCSDVSNVASSPPIYSPFTSTDRPLGRCALREEGGYIRAGFILKTMVFDPNENASGIVNLIHSVMRTNKSICFQYLLLSFSNLMVIFWLMSTDKILRKFFTALLNSFM